MIRFHKFTSPSVAFGDVLKRARLCCSLEHRLKWKRDRDEMMANFEKVKVRVNPITLFARKVIKAIRTIFGAYTFVIVDIFTQDNDES